VKLDYNFSSNTIDDDDGKQNDGSDEESVVSHTYRYDSAFDVRNLEICTVSAASAAEWPSLELPLGVVNGVNDVVIAAISESVLIDAIVVIIDDNVFTFAVFSFPAPPPNHLWYDWRMKGIFFHLILILFFLRFSEKLEGLILFSDNDEDEGEDVAIYDREEYLVFRSHLRFDAVG